MIEAVIFDMDGLLIDTEPYWQRTERLICKELGIHVTQEMQKATFGLRTDEQTHYWYNYQPWENPDFDAVNLRYETIVMDFFINEASLMEGVNYILDFTKSTGLKMALASSSSMKLINIFIDKFQMKKYFPVIYSAEHEEYGKPHPAVYLTTAKLLKTHPSSCLAFEDSFNGLLAAKAAKMKAVSVPDPNHFDDKRFSISDLKLKSLLDFDIAKLNSLNSNF